MDKGSSKERLIIKIVCVLLSFCLWIYVTNVETIIKTFTLKNVPVQVINVEALKNYGLALAPGQEFEVNLNLEGPAKYIYSVKKSDFTIRADLSEYALKKGENNIPVQIINSPQEINIKNNGYLIVKINLEALETKTFKSVSDVKLSFAQNVYKEGIEFTPEDIQVSGPASVVNQVAKVALVGNLSDISEPITKSFRYEALNANGQIVKDVELSKSTGTISVSTNTGKKVSIIAHMTGALPNGITLVSTQLSQSSVTVIGNKQILNGLKSLNTEPIDLSKISQDTTQNVKLILPQGVTLSSGDGTVNVSIDVTKKEPEEEKIENINKEFNIQLASTGLQKDLKIEKVPTNISIQVTGQPTIINALTANDFIANIDLSNYKDAGTFELTPKVTVNKEVTIDSIPNVTVVLSKVEANDTREVKNSKVGEEHGDKNK